MERVYLAVDLGAGSGRVLAGLYDGTRLALREVHRFPSEAIKLSDGWHWNLFSILSNIEKGIALALKEFGDSIVSVGVDSWAVDYGIIDQRGELLNLPFQYRDKRTEGYMEKAFAQMPKSEIYQRTGIQFLAFNTLYQLLSERASLEHAAKAGGTLLFIPDLVNYFLTGRKCNERSNASTSQLLEIGTNNWDRKTLSQMKIPESLFGELVDAGTELGFLLPESKKPRCKLRGGVFESQNETGNSKPERASMKSGQEIKTELSGEKLKVIAVGSHDTASAVVGIPSLEENPVFLSSGTWSLFGRELKSPILTDESYQAGYSNEGGVYGTTRFLKNISGMWLLQECKRCWGAAGQSVTFDELVRLAETEPATSIRIDPDAKEFQNPGNMPSAIAEYCRLTRQAMPTTQGQVTRVILESLADKYAQAKTVLEKLTGESIRKIYIVGGGSQNLFLNQLTANATGCEVVAGPVEATSLGNILVQMLTAKDIDSLQKGRELASRSFSIRHFLPQIR